MSELPQSPWTDDAEALLRSLRVDRNKGLSGEAVKKRRREHGSNRIEQKTRKSVWSILYNQFKSIIVLLLAAAALTTFVVGRWMEGVAISIVVIFNALIGFLTELRAVRSMEALEKLSQSVAKVRRSGRIEKIPSWKLVPGDIVVFEAGDTVSADMRLIEAARVEADESTLTGESLPVAKNTESVGQDTPLVERRCMLFNGTAITRGSGEAVVVATGMATELGKISEEIQQAGEEHTPLEDRLDQLGRTFIWLTVILSVIIIVVGWLSGRDLLLVVETGIALAVAAIPEGMPIVATIALARGMRRMVRRNALVNRLSSVETLGSATIIATDKTGTLTENQMTVTRLVLPDMEFEVTGEGLDTEGSFNAEGGNINPEEHEFLRLILQTGALCGNAELQTRENGRAGAVGDPMEIALLVAAEKAGLERKKLLEEYPEEYEVAFDTEKKMMATVHRSNEGYFFAVKGAPEKVVQACNRMIGAQGDAPFDDELRGQWVERSKEQAARGLRILALAMKETSRRDDQPYTDLTFLGLACFLDPPREEVKEAIAAAHTAGIRTIMITGDQIATARAIAGHLQMASGEIKAMEGHELKKIEEAGDAEKKRILECTVFARVTPKQKLDLITLYQQEGNVVAMTGDGVNDAPALEKADIGVAMGRRGTQVAREAADMILKDDSFSTIVAAIEEGRIIFGNIRQFILFLLTISLSMILTVFFGSILSLPMPVLPLQVLYLNAVTHVFPALALGMGEGHENIMHEPPRDPALPILERRHWLFIIFHAAIISIAVLIGLFVSLKYLGRSIPQSQTISFLIITFGQLLHVFNVRGKATGTFINDVTRNIYVWIAIAVSVLLTLAILYIPGPAAVMMVVAPGLSDWITVMVFSTVPFFLGQLYLKFRNGG
ncbi:MAG: cation-transporting P-type ATPase [Desulfobulbaceae bacterium]|nr:cation-transporting P-type ATPase [Desulfobulbaceae bacterium]